METQIGFTADLSQSQASTQLGQMCQLGELMGKGAASAETETTPWDRLTASPDLCLHQLMRV